MTKKICTTTSDGKDADRRERNRKAAEASRQRKVKLQQSYLDKIQQLEENIQLLKSQICNVDKLYKQIADLKKQLSTWKNMYYDK
jgi:phage shock protein A